MSKNTEEDKLRSLLEKKQLEPFIQHIRFPHYKNLSPDTRIEFTYPITALVGANGTNKSSVIRALFGAPGRNNLGNYWFSTSIDPIIETGDARNCFIYGYWNNTENNTVEVLKTRIRKEDDPDYWEPSRPIIKYAMAEMPPLPLDNQNSIVGRSKTRWNAIEKNVVFLDFRADLSAYDKFMYHGELRNQQSTHKNKKDLIRRRSSHLGSAIKFKKTTYEYYGERIVEKENRNLSNDELLEVSTILGRKYSEITLIRHTFFNCDAYTSIMKVAELNYSEAFAGSGEFAVVRLVTGIFTAPDYSLILLDEPEVSLHPGAQDRLMEFLSKMVKLKKLQFVISTHSPAIVRHLPQDAIKVFVMAKNGKVIIPSQKSLPEEAFFYLGEPIPGKITVVVEDALAGEIIRRAIRLAGEAAAKLFDIRYFAGGSQTLWGHYIPAFAIENRADILVLFDGDQRPTENFPDPDTISIADESRIKELILNITGVDVSFKIDGGDGGTNTTQLNEMRRQYIGWARKYVDFLPGTSSPEAFLCENMKKKADGNATDHSNTKEMFEILTRKLLGLEDYEQVKSNDILSTQRRELAAIPDDNPELIKLKHRLLAAISSHKTND